ncbi:MAG: glycosyltransferase family 4 protein [Candidatus Eremiobacteraeota bacterium]|nr:glycosyltransferase family 4 protein [Candidatus Eremiobacteraeota bacterium]
MRRIRVLHLIDILKGGGVEEWVKEISRLMPREKFEMKLCYLLESHQRVYIEELTSLGTKVTYIGLPKKISKSILSSPTLSDNPFFRSIARYGYIPYCLTLIKSLCRLAVKERIEVIHTHLHYSFITGSIVGRFLNIPVICQIPQMRSQTLKTASWSFLAYRLLKNCVSSFFTNISAEELIKYSGVSPEKIIYFKGVVDLNDIRPVKRDENPLVKEFGLQGAFPILLSIGRFVPEKGHKYAIDVAERLKVHYPAMKLFILGEGWEMNTFRSLVCERGLSDTIILPGYRRDLNYFYSLTDIYLRTYLIEGGNLSNYAASAYGNPIVGFDTKAPTETIIDGHNGFLVPTKDVEKMVACLMELASDEELRRRIGQANREFAFANLDIMSTMRLFQSEYERLSLGRAPSYRKKKYRARPHDEKKPATSIT